MFSLECLNLGLYVQKKLNNNNLGLCECSY